MLRRIADVAVSAVLLVLTSPFFLITAFAVWLTDFGPIVYRQTRAGIHGLPFELLKFRSMRINNRPLNTMEELGEMDPLVSPVGRWIRRFKMDELPQLINVMRGEMSWVGPRPTVLEQVSKYTPFQRRRLNILPGMTGWAQVNGGTELTWPERIVLEVWYVEHRTWLIDLEVMWRTVGVILFGYKCNHRALDVALRFAKQQADDVDLQIAESRQATTAHKK